MWSGFQAKKLNSRGERELEFAANRAEPERQAGPDPDQKQNLIFFFAMPFHHVNVRPSALTYVLEKGAITIYTNRKIPCRIELWYTVYPN